MVRRPALAFVEDLAEPLLAISRHFTADPRPVGGSLFRIQRDTRFAKDKTPVQDPHRPPLPPRGHPRRRARPRLLPAPRAGELLRRPGPVAAGHRARPGHPRRHRRPVRGLGPGHPPAALLARSTPWARATPSVRPPQGFAPDHPLLDDLKRRDFTASTRLTQARVTAPGFLDDYVGRRCGPARPFMRFLCEALRPGLLRPPGGRPPARPHPAGAAPPERAPLRRLDRPSIASALNIGARRPIRRHGRSRGSPPPALRRSRAQCARPPWSVLRAGRRRRLRHRTGSAPRHLALGGRHRRLLGASPSLRPAAYRRHDRRYRSLLDRVPVGLYRTAPDGRIVDVNPALAHIFGFETPAETARRPGPLGLRRPGRPRPLDRPGQPGAGARRGGAEHAPPGRDAPSGSGTEWCRSATGAAGCAATKASSRTSPTRSGTARSSRPPCAPRSS